jgi:hypothetical protein
MEDIAPGSILQRMFLRNRISRFKQKTFCEIGAGNGYISEIFLNLGYTGICFDLNASACEKNRDRNKSFINSGKFSVLNENFFEKELTQKFDVIISCMVIEHLPENIVNQYFERCRNLLDEKGTIIVMVPASMKYWGIEDEIAGHFKRYEFDDFKAIASKYKLEVHNLSGLTYPLSNWLFGLSNKIVKRNEGYKKSLSMQEQTVLSGNRNNKYKSSFPPVFKLILNEFVLYPFYLLQRIFSKHPHSMILYCEMKPL